MQKARGQDCTGPEGPMVSLPLLVGIWFQVLFHSPSGVLFTFPSQYWFTIGRLVVFSLRRWSSQIHAGFLVSHATWVLQAKDLHRFVYGTITLYGWTFHSI